MYSYLLTYKTLTLVHYKDFDQHTAPFIIFKIYGSGTSRWDKKKGNTWSSELTLTNASNDRYHLGQVMLSYCQEGMPHMSIQIISAPSLPSTNSHPTLPPSVPR